MNHTESAGIYIHIPFCRKKCSYCDFYSITNLSLKAEFVRVLCLEMQMISDPPLEVDTLYIGGGTPSLLDAVELSHIIKTARQQFNILPDAEITIEVNPGTVSPELLRDYREAGINRINIGVQSFQNKHLDFLSRIHTEEASSEAIQWAQKAGFENIGIDLIYGIPGQTEASWLSDLHRAADVEPAHISCYMLTYEHGTLLEKNRQKGLFHPLSDDFAAHLFETTIAFLTEHGYIHYEISNFARSESEISRHNWKYWSFNPYFGFGPSAHSFQNPIRYWNVRSVEKYIHEIQNNKLPIAGKEILTKDQQMTEAIYVGLRKREGIDIEEFEKRFNISFKQLFSKIILYLKEDELIEINPYRCQLSRKGLLFLDSIAAYFTNAF